MYALYRCFEIVEGYCDNFRQTEYMGIPVFYFSLGTALSMLILFFRPPQSWKRWTYFAVWALPLSVTLSAYLITSRIGGFLGEPTPGFKTLMVAVPFFLISLVIILWPVSDGTK